MSMTTRRDGDLVGERLTGDERRRPGSFSMIRSATGSMTSIGRVSTLSSRVVSSVDVVARRRVGVHALLGVALEDR